MLLLHCYCSSVSVPLHFHFHTLFCTTVREKLPEQSETQTLHLYITICPWYRVFIWVERAVSPILYSPVIFCWCLQTLLQTAVKGLPDTALLSQMALACLQGMTGSMFLNFLTPVAVSPILATRLAGLLMCLNVFFLWGVGFLTFSFH